MLYLTSTSNHNLMYKSVMKKWVVLYLTSTSNHNFVSLLFFFLIVVLYLTSTSNHNQTAAVLLLSFVVLYLTSTSNHNYNAFRQTASWLCYILLLHRTTTTGCYTKLHECCVISYFYIEPQHLTIRNRQLIVVLYLTSTSNHNSIRRDNTKVRLCYILLLHRTTTF